MCSGLSLLSPTRPDLSFLYFPDFQTTFLVENNRTYWRDTNLLMETTGKAGSRGRWTSEKVVAPSVDKVPYGKLASVV